MADCGDGDGLIDFIEFSALLSGEDGEDDSATKEAFRTVPAYTAQLL